MPRINARVTRDGEVTFDVQNGVGASCTQLTAPYERHFGQVDDQTLKPEYHSAETRVEDRVNLDGDPS